MEVKIHQPTLGQRNDRPARASPNPVTSGSYLECLGCKFPRLDLVYITPNPGFAGLDRADKGMVRIVKVFSGVFVLGRVAATGMPADEAHAQMDPGSAGLNAVLPNMFSRFSFFC